MEKTVWVTQRQFENYFKSLEKKNLKSHRTSLTWVSMMGKCRDLIVEIFGNEVRVKENWKETATNRCLETAGQGKKGRSHAKTESVEEILREAKYHKKEGDKYGSLMYSNPGKYSRYYGQPVPFGYEAEIAEYKKMRDSHNRKYDRLMDKLDQDTWNGPYYLKKKKGGK